MDLKQKLGSGLLAKIEQGSSLKEISQWASEIYPDYCFFHTTGEIDNETYFTLIDLMSMCGAPEFEMSEEWLRVIADTLMDTGEFSKVQLGWSIKQWIEEEHGASYVRKLAKNYIEDCSYEDHELYADDELYAIIQHFWGIDSECNVELTEAELRLLAKLLIEQAKDPMDTMIVMARENYERKNKSRCYDLGNVCLDLFNEKDVNIDDLYLAVFNYKHAINEWDVRAFNQLGIAYANIGRVISSSQLKMEYFLLAIDSFNCAVSHNNETRSYFNLGMAYGELASLCESKSSFFDAYKNAAHWFQNAIDSGDRKAYGHLSIIYESLGSNFEDKRSKSNYLKLAIKNARIAVKDGWTGCNGIIGLAYSQLGDLTDDTHEYQKYNKLAINYFKKAVASGHIGYAEDLEKSFIKFKKKSRYCLKLLEKLLSKFCFSIRMKNLS